MNVFYPTRRRRRGGGGGGGGRGPTAPSPLGLGLKVLLVFVCLSSPHFLVTCSSNESSSLSASPHSDIILSTPFNLTTIYDYHIAGRESDGGGGEGGGRDSGSTLGVRYEFGQRLGCVQPPRVDFAQSDLHTSKKEVFSLGSRAHYSCHNGFRRVSGSEPLVCRQSSSAASGGSWEGPPVKCQLLPVNGTWAPSAERDGLMRAKRSYSHERHIEIMVVADPKMARYHGENLRHYILTLMATVALIYRDATIGNAINIAIVKLTIMDEDEARDIIYNSASKTLRHFCRWQQSQNHQDDNHPQHHDTAILLTREDLCRMPKTCDTLGLAQLGQICDYSSSCAVIEDNGLSAAFTIAHELGHVLSIPHDDTDKCARFHEEGQRYHIMARMLDYNSHPWTWSSCSRYFLTDFLDAGNGECLLDKPSENLLKEAITGSDYGGETAELRQPGELFDMDYQCELVFGPTSKICPYMPVCKRLWCTIGINGGCRTQHMPWADGTSCGRNKWCQQGECVPVTQTMISPKDGQWGAWSELSTCTRQCGGGIQKATRECDQPKPAGGGKYCVGHRVRYQSCNTQECSPGTPDFREEQCAAFNGQTFNIQGLPADVKWAPHYTGIVSSDSCKLYCSVIGTGAYYLLKQKVVDGTPCAPDSNDVCVNGRCNNAGCDHILGSERRPDSCGVCGGNNSTCKIIRGHFNQVQVSYGYNIVASFPLGANNLDIRQHGLSHEDNNYLALRGHDGQYILNGDFVVSMFRKTIQYEGTTIEYSGSNNDIERINASKPISKPLFVEVLSVGNLLSPDIRYQYAVSLRPGETDHETVHDTSTCKQHKCGQWKASEWEECSRECGGGIETRRIWCSESDGSVISEKYCDQSTKPSRAQRCARDPCPAKPAYRWYIGPWTKCLSFGCSTNGTRRRLVLCISDKEEKVDLRYCGSTIPVDTQSCHAVPIKCPISSTTTMSSTTSAITKSLTSLTTPTTISAVVIPRSRWVYGEWEPCSATCGNGTQTRRPLCQGQKETGIPCHMDQKPDLQQRFCLKSCSLFHWKIYSWSSCSATCGRGFRTRLVECLDWAQSVVSDHFCDPSTRPKSIKKCRINACPFVWQMNPWSDCSEPCGKGAELRKVTCHRINEYGWIDPHPVRKRKKIHEKLNGWCNETVKPSSRRNCIYGDCSGPVWRPEPWQPCSVACGSGKQKRRVPCYNSLGKKVPRSFCDSRQRPPRRRKCFLRPCAPISCMDIYTRTTGAGAGTGTQYSDGEYDIWIRGKLAKVYCSGMQVGQPVEYLTLRAGRFENYSEIYNKRQTKADSCPPQGRQCENCFVSDTRIGGGLTQFTRIRLNITSLLVYTNDYQFSDTQSGWQIGYGEAGDCYSTVGCPQGQFKINLTGTGFIVSPKTRWMMQGNKATKQINRIKNGEIAFGRCGGYCGRCFPSNGLYLDLAPSRRS